MPHSYTSGLNSESDEVKSLSEERDTAFDNLGSVIESRLKESEHSYRGRLGGEGLRPADDAPAKQRRRCCYARGLGRILRSDQQANSTRVSAPSAHTSRPETFRPLRPVQCGRSSR